MLKDAEMGCKVCYTKFLVQSFFQYLNFQHFEHSRSDIFRPCDLSLSAQPISVRKHKQEKKPINLCAPHELLKNVSTMFDNLTMLLLLGPGLRPGPSHKMQMVCFLS